MIAFAERHLFVDLDGTLIDPAQGVLACFRHAVEGIAELPPWFEQDGARLIGPPLRAGMAELLGTSDEVLIERAVGAFRRRFQDVGIFECRIYDGVEVALERARRRARIFVVTSKAAAYAHPIVEHLGLWKHVEGVFGSELDGTRANKGELIRYALGQTGADPALTMMVGDRRYDIEGGREAGTRTLGATWGFGSESELLAARPDALVRRVEDLPTAIDAVMSER